MRDYRSIYRLVALCGALSVPCTDNASPDSMAAHLEQTLVQGSGVLFPDEELPAALHCGSIAVDDSWPAGFLDRVGETVSVSISPDTGLYDFRDGDGTLFWIEVPFAPLTSNWIAPFLHPFGGGDADLLSPFRLTETWTLVSETRLADGANLAKGVTGANLPPPSDLRFTSFTLTPSNLTFTADWPTNDSPIGLPPPGGILDLYCATNLTEYPWAILHAETGVTNPPVEFTISGALVPGWNAATGHVHDVTCPVVTNVVLSPLDGEGVYTNIVYGCGYSPPPPEAGFFRLGTRFDTDGDGLPDAYESLSLGTDASLADSDADGMGDAFDVDPLAAASPATPEDVAANLTSLALLPPLSAVALPFNAATGVVASLPAIAVNRTGTWQQYYLSGAPSNAVPVLATNASLSVFGASGQQTLVTYGPAELSLAPRVPATMNELALGFLLQSDLPAARLDSPLHLLAWTPEVTYVPGDGIVTGVVNGAVQYAAAGECAALGVAIDRSSRPSLAPVSSDEIDDSPFTGVSPLVWDGVWLHATSPGAYALPTLPPPLPDAPIAANWLSNAPVEAVPPTQTNHFIVVNPTIYFAADDAPKGCMRPAGGTYAAVSSYPLDTPSLRRAVNSASDGTPGARVVLDLGFDGPATPLCTSIRPLRGTGYEGTAYFPDDSGSTNIVWQGTCWRDFHEESFPDDTETLSEGGDDAEDCGCGDLAASEGDSLGSLAFRIPLGFPRPGQIAGFLWLRLQTPETITPETFRITARDDAAVMDEPLPGGGRLISCVGERGRAITIAPSNEVLVATVRDAATGALLHTWEFSRPDNASVRIRRITRGGNVQRDVSYAKAGASWSRANHADGSVETLTRTDDLDGPTGILTEERAVADVAGVTLRRTVTESRRIGSGTNAVLRETERRTLAPGGTWLVATASYWEDDGHPLRNGRPRLIAGDDRAWSYHNYDALGRETFRADQLDGSFAPWDGDEFDIDYWPYYTDCTVTIFSYEPLVGDSADPMDERTPRTVSRYVLRSFNPSILVAREWTVVTRGVDAGGVPTVTHRTERAASQVAIFGDTGNAVSESTSYSSGAPGVPLLLRGRPISETGEDGMTTHYQYHFGAWDPDLRSFAENVGETHLRVRSWRTTAAAPQGLPWRTTVSETVEETAHGNEIWSATRVLGDGGGWSVPFDWESRVFDEQDRLRFTLFSDGSSSTNDYSCCRLLSMTDREGRKILRSAVTGQDHLYWAEEDFMPTRNTAMLQYLDALMLGSASHPVTQHFFDALGRETNTVRLAVNGFGAATSANVSAAGGLRMADVREYPDGVDGHMCRTDVRGLVTVSRERPSQSDSVSVTETWPSSDAAAPESVVTNTAVRGGGLVSETHWADSWTRRSSFDAYATDGTRTAYSVTESSDSDCVTNSITHFDFLGRSSDIETPLSSVAYTYDDASSTVLSEADAVSGVTTDMLHDPATGEECGSASFGVTNLTDTSYALLGGEVWRVTTEATFSGAVTNAFSARREQLTGLSDALRAHIVDATLAGPTRERTTSFDAAHTNVIEILQDSASGFCTNIWQFGRIARQDFLYYTLHHHCDGLGRRYTSMRSSSSNRDAKGYTIDYIGYGRTGDIDFELSGYKDGMKPYLWTDYARDTHGRVVNTTNHIGGVSTRAYDGMGRLAGRGGPADFPSQVTYDALGRRTSLSTTRNGSAWDTTSWDYDPATGLATAKTYADETAVSYSHTADGLPLRTTWARRAWRESGYDAARREVSRHYSDPSLDCVFERDVFGAIISASNAVAEIAILRNDPGMVTNETHVIEEDAFSIDRAYDANGRLTSLEWAADGDTSSRHIVYAYNSVGLLATVSNELLSVSYDYHDYGHELGYTLMLPSGARFVRTVSRFIRPPNATTAVSNFFVTVTGETNALPSFTYVLDDLLRPTGRNADSFAYDARSQLTSATLRSSATNSFAYAYDSAGNRVQTSQNGEPLYYAANELNQYDSTTTYVMLTPSIPWPITTNFVHDLDGNLLTNDVWSYTWDAENRLASVYNEGCYVVSNAYDAFSRRILKVTPTETHTFLYDGWNVVREEVRSTATGGATATFDYYWGRDLSGSLQGAGGVGGLLAYTRNGALRIPVYDHIGNVVAVVDDTGAIVAAYEYDPFGNIIAQSGAEANEVPFRFSTKYFDSETGLYYYGYRFYAPLLGRWINRDPIEEEGGLNLHAFCGNSPVSYSDAHGEHRLNNFPHHGEEYAGYVFVSFLADAWCVRPRNRPVNDTLAFVLSTGMWGGFESVQLAISKNSEQKVGCAGGYLVFRIFPKIGYPSEISKIKDFEIGNPVNGNYAGSPAGFPLNNDFSSKFADLYGPGRVVGYDQTYFHQYPIYEYNNSRFNLGWRYEKSGLYDGHPYSEEYWKDHLFTKWDSMWHRPKGNDGSVRINVSCGDRVHLQMGNVGQYEINQTFIITDYNSSRIID